MSFILQTTLELGMMYALVSMALYLSFRVLDIADLTTDGAFVLGMAVSVTVTALGHPFLAMPTAMLCGAAAGYAADAVLPGKPGWFERWRTLQRFHYSRALCTQCEQTRAFSRLKRYKARRAIAGTCCPR